VVKPESPRVHCRYDPLSAQLSTYSAFTNSASRVPKTETINGDSISPFFCCRLIGTANINAIKDRTLDMGKLRERLSSAMSP
jgi:hypothetical protein